MRLLFVHQNFPGQYLHLAPQMAKRGHEVAALSKREGVTMPGVRINQYKLADKRYPGTHPLLRRVEGALRYGESAIRGALALREEGFTPDVICVHPGWGEALFLKDLWPRARQLHYCEFHLRPYGPAQIFEPRDPLTLEQIFASRMNTATELLAFDAMHAGVTPTHWQHRQYPAHIRDRISVIHEGVNTSVCRPNPGATFTLPNGRVLRRGDKVVTYVSRNLEPMRGFPQFMRAVEVLLREDPSVVVVVIGGHEVSYGSPHPSGRSWKDVILDEVTIDPARVHFLGKVRYEHYLAVLQISSAHVYLTVPFVLSWSALEAMSAGCLMIASSTQPVLEVIEDGVNGVTFDFFDRDTLVDRLLEALRRPDDFAGMRNKARETVLDRYALTRCLPLQIELVESTAE